MVAQTDTSFLDLEPGSDSGLDFPHNFNTSDSDPEPPLLINGSLLNTTRLVSSSHSSRTVHAHEQIKAVENPQYGSFYSEYDPMTGARTAAILGSLLMMLVFYIVYKAKCHQEWTDEDDYYLQQYKQRQQNKALMKQAPRKSVNYIIDPVCHPDPHILAATAQWVKMQPLETAVPDPLPGEKRRPRYPLSRMPSISAENINRQMLNAVPFIPNGHGPPQHEDHAQRSCNEYVPNGYLKNISKDCLQRPEWAQNETQCASRGSHLDPDDLFLELGSYSRRQSSYDEAREHEDRDVFIHVEVKPEKAAQLSQCSNLDRHNNNHNDGAMLETNAFSLDMCTNCMTDMNLSGRTDSRHQKSTLIQPTDTDLSLARRSHRSRSRPRSKQRSMETGSSLGSSSQQPSMDDDSPVFCVGMLPARDAAPVSLDINDFSSNENSSDHQLASSSNARVPVLSYFNNLVSNSTFSTMSTATASSNGSYQSEGADIPLSDLPPSLPPEDTTAVIAEQPKHVVEVTIETALESSSKSHDEMDTKL